MKCKNGQINKIYLLNYNDCVFDKGTLIRIKRKYGKYKREIKVIKKKKDN